MEAMPTVSSSVEKLPQIPHISLTQRHQTIRHPEKCSKPENDAICGLMGGPTTEWLAVLTTETVVSLLLVTKTYLPFGVTATPIGLFPAGMGGPTTVFVAVLITEIVPSWLF